MPQTKYKSDSTPTIWGHKNDVQIPLKYMSESDQMSSVRQHPVDLLFLGSYSTLMNFFQEK